MIKNGVLYADKSKAGNVSFKKEFTAIHKVGVQIESIKNIKIFVYNYCVEIFINNGELLMTTLEFSALPLIRISGDKTIQYQWTPIKSIWDSN